MNSVDPDTTDGLDPSLSSPLRREFEPLLQMLEESSDLSAQSRATLLSLLVDSRRS